MNTDIEKLHKCLLKILDEIDRLCRKYDIPYFLDSGTALGAIRHKGFIPWDDDADVGLLRKDYERFIEVAKTDLSPEFFLQTADIESEYPNFNAKIRLNGTHFPEQFNEKRNIHKGISVDIFPFDYVKNDEKKIISNLKFYRFLISIHQFTVNRENNTTFLKKTLRFICKKLPTYRLLKRLALTKHLRKPTEKVVCYTYRMNSNKILCFDTNDLNSVHYTKFADRNYLIMDGYDSYLKTLYGDYMKLPPENERYQHIQEKIDFGIYE